MKPLHATTERAQRRSNGIGGALATLGSLPWFMTARLDQTPYLSTPLWSTLAWALAAVASMMWLGAGIAIDVHPRTGRQLTLLAIVGTLSLGAPFVLVSPLLTLTLLVVVAIFVAIIVRATARRWAEPGDAPVYLSNARGAAFVSLALWASAHLLGSHLTLVQVIALSAALSVPALMLLVAMRKEIDSRHSLAAAIAIAAQCALVLWSFTHQVPWGVLNSSIVLPLTALFMPSGNTRQERDGLLDSMLGHPERLFVGTFATLCALGTVALCLPHAAADGHNIAFLDALFTAVSAVCVTGLAVLDTPNDLSITGQVILLALIQTGGLGIMTFSTAALRMFGGRMSLRHESAVASLISDRDRRQLHGSAQRVLVFTLASELLGAAFLTLRFHAHGDHWGMAAWRGAFTSISAFCNAGFALQTDSLMMFESDPMVLHVIGTLIVIGGLSPAAVLAIPAWVRRVPSPIALQIKLSLVTTGALIAIGFVAILAFEWSHSLAHLAWDDRFHNAMFQSITLRTAGFNSIDLTLIQPATLSLMIVWMFIGGSPGGTAGGIKTTTTAILFLAVSHAMRGHWTVAAFGRRVADRTLRKATVVMTLAVSTVMFALVALQLTQDMPIEVGVFEIVSALGTVGLTTGGTALLDGVGKIIITACMFIGRVGGLSMLMFLSQRKPRVSEGFLEQDVDVG